MKRAAALAIAASALWAAQTESSPLHSVTAVRHWATAESTRVAIEVTGEFKFRSDRLHDPERVYFDILDARPRIAGHRFFSETVDDKLLQRVRVAETAPGVTRIVLDLAADAEISTSQLTSPNRLMIELRKWPAQPTEPHSPASPSLPASAPKPLSPAPPILPNPSVLLKAPPVVKAEFPPVSVEAPKPPILPAKVSPPKSAPEKIASEKFAPDRVTVAETTPLSPPPAASAKPESNLSTIDAELGRAARHTSSGDLSLVRALGLKVSRVVIDPGHGGHDEGTQGVHGLLEKDLVLDVARRVGKLIEDRMGAEVIYTRTDDTFIPLEGRTALANDKKADLFISIHANSSPVPRIAGVETYYLNFSTSKDALDVAARENATSQKSIFDLQDIVQKITLHDKVEESREFAGRIQSSLYSFSARSFPSEKNRGVKKAPFIVLIGATMPSVLVEIGFLSNSREETLLKRPDYRQKLADALYRGISRYADTLSHFQVAKNQQ
jgi:N-acetylmuramoyl-L-alanine amidase